MRHSRNWFSLLFSLSLVSLSACDSCTTGDVYPQDGTFADAEVDGGSTEDGATDDAEIDADVDGDVDADMDADVDANPCEPGYGPNAEGECVDLDECADGTDTCDDAVTCTNTVGNFECGECPPELRAHGSNPRVACIDVDECLYVGCGEGNGCTNTRGSFECAPCPSGTTSNGRTQCRDIDECLDPGCGRGFSCENTFGSYICTPCPSGFDALGHNPFCHDINECDPPGCGRGNACTNTTGGYMCTPCGSGFTGAGQAAECVDVNECARVTTFSCEDDLLCVNTEGSYECGVCPSGTAEGLFGNCEDLDECALGTDTCSDIQQCTNTYGSFECEDASSVVAGYAHTCVLFSGGSVKCWGARAGGVAGYGDNVQINAPRPAALKFAPAWRVARIVAAGMHSCALYENGAITCWGLGSELGHGIGLGAGGRSVPTYVTVNLGEGCADGACVADDVFVGEHATCALFDESDIKCWGHNGFGQLGYGDNYHRSVPPASTFVDVGHRRVMSVRGGNVHMCALLTGGDVKCWGNNQVGQNGYGEGIYGEPLFENSAPFDAEVNLGEDCGVEHCHARSLMTGKRQTCVILEDGRVRCWGNNEFGALGYGDTMRRYVPPAATVNLGAGRTAVRLVGGEEFTCALLDDGTVKCWGKNDLGQLGYGDTTHRLAPDALPIDFGDEHAVIDLAAGTSHVCALLDDRSLRCWGQNATGQLGYGDTMSRTSPGAAVNLSGY